MIAVGMFLLFVAYGMGYWGYSMLKGWNLGFKQLFSPTQYYQGKWPPPLAGNTVIIPDGTAASGSSADFGTTGATQEGTQAGSGAQGEGVTPVSVSSSAAAIQKAAAMFGWGSGNQWACLTRLITQESGGNPNARNPSSGAFGIAQALGHGQSGTSGCGRNEYGAQYGLSASQASAANCGGTAGAYYQAIWMMGYIKAVYGNPCGAWAHEQSHNWY